MNIKNLALLLFLLFVTSSTSFAQKPNCDELAEILSIESWRVAAPRDERFYWIFSVVDYAPRKFTDASATRLNPEQKDLATLRPTGKDTYESAVKTSKWVDRSRIKLDICTDEEKKNNLCENIYTIKWYVEAKPYGNGTSFLVADITKRGSPRKQIILKLGMMLGNATKSKKSVP